MNDDEGKSALAEYARWMRIETESANWQTRTTFRCSELSSSEACLAD